VASGEKKQKFKTKRVGDGRRKAKVSPQKAPRGEEKKGKSDGTSVW